MDAPAKVGDPGDRGGLFRREDPRDYERLSLPTLVLHGLDDGLVPPQASERLASLPNVERRTYLGLRHELHNEPEGPVILAEVVAWLRQRATLDVQPNTASGERLAR